MCNHQKLEKTGSWQLSGASKQELVDIFFGVQLLRECHSYPVKIQVSKRKETPSVGYTFTLWLPREQETLMDSLMTICTWEWVIPKKSPMNTEREEEGWPTGHQLSYQTLRGCIEATFSGTFVT